MDLMQLRRNMMGVIASSGGSAEQIGIFTKGYEATLKPGATNSFVIQHDLGIMPRLCIIEMDRSTAQLTSYCYNVIIDFDVHGMRSDKTGHERYRYRYNNSDQSSGNSLPSSAVTVDEEKITLIPPYSTGRSPWDTSADYHVRVWG